MGGVGPPKRAAAEVSTAHALITPKKIGAERHLPSCLPHPTLQKHVAPACISNCFSISLAFSSAQWLSTHKASLKRAQGL